MKVGQVEGVEVGGREVLEDVECRARCAARSGLHQVEASGVDVGARGPVSLDEGGVLFPAEETVGRWSVSHEAEGVANLVGGECADETP